MRRVEEDRDTVPREPVRIAAAQLASLDVSARDANLLHEAL